MKKVVLMEDDELLGGELCEELRGVNYEVKWARDGEEGLALIAEEVPDLVLLDLMMPKVTGVEVLKRLKKDEKTKHLVVVTLSNLAGVDDVKYAKSLGAADHLVKGDSDLDEIVEVAVSYLEK